jgi:hypothetical protein
MAKHKIDYFTKEDINNVSTITFAHGGTPCNVSIDTYKNLVSITKDFCNEYECIHGAFTSVTFQYSMVLELTNHETIWKRKNKTSFIENAISEVLKLASYNFTITRINNNEVAIISPHYQKLEAISKLMDYAKDFFNFKYIGISKFDGEQLLDSYNLNGCDIIKSAQTKDRHFDFKWVTDRANKYLN